MRLLEAGADPNAADKEDNTPLHLACRSGAKNTALSLLSKGASLTKPNKFDQVPIDLAEKYGHTELVALLKASEGKAPEEFVAEDDPQVCYDAPEPLGPTICSVLTDEMSLKHLTFQYESPLPHHYPCIPPENTERLEVLIGPYGSLSSSEFDDVDRVLCDKPAALSDVLRVHDYAYLRHLTDFCGKLSKFIDGPPHETAVYDHGDTSVSQLTAAASMHAAGAVIEAVDRFFFSFPFFLFFFFSLFPVVSHLFPSELSQEPQRLPFVLSVHLVIMLAHTVLIIFALQIKGTDFVF